MPGIFKRRVVRRLAPHYSLIQQLINIPDMLIQVARIVLFAYGGWMRVQIKSPTLQLNLTKQSRR